MIIYIELIINILLTILDIGVGVYLVRFLYSIPGNKKLERRLQKKKDVKKVFKITLIIILLNVIYFIYYF